MANNYSDPDDQSSVVAQGVQASANEALQDIEMISNNIAQTSNDATCGCDQRMEDSEHEQTKESEDEQTEEEDGRSEEENAEMLFQAVRAKLNARTRDLLEYPCERFETELTKTVRSSDRAGLSMSREQREDLEAHCRLLAAVCSSITAIPKERFEKVSAQLMNHVSGVLGVGNHVETSDHEEGDEDEDEGEDMDQEDSPDWSMVELVGFLGEQLTEDEDQDD